MKYLNHPIPLRLWLLFIIFACISLAIWFCGPFLIVANAAPFAQTDKRFYLITFLFCCLFLKIYYLDNFIQSRRSPKNPAFIKNLRLLEGRIQGAMRFLKKTFIQKQGRSVSLSNLPWYLLIGPTGSGKTSLLANANINFILSKQFKNEIIPPSDTCDWWATREAVLLDVPGSYIHLKHKSLTHNADFSPVVIYHRLWESLLDLVKKHRGPKAISGIIVALSFPELILQKQQQKKSILLELKQSINELKKQFGTQLSYHIIITKCDLIPGFSEFFSDSTSDELAQAWGITLPTFSDNHQLLSTFTNRFNALIKRLNKQLIWRLHQTRCPIARHQIKDFPLQIERVKKNILSLLKTLSEPNEVLTLNGVYLTSATQAMMDETISIDTTPAKAESLITREPLMPSKAYFVRQLLIQGLPGIVFPPTRSRSRVYLALAVSCFSVTCLTLSLFFATPITYGIKQSYLIAENHIKQYPDAAKRMYQQLLRLTTVKNIELL